MHVVFGHDVASMESREDDAGALETQINYRDA